jgi:transglutaminase-like putative cysteine protease
MSSEDLRPFLEPTPTIESEHPEIVAFAGRHCAGADEAVERAVRLYYAVRDGIRYDPYALELSVKGLCATTTLRAGRGWCVAKAILLAAACRSLGIPIRLGFADVRNHLSTERMRKTMKTDIFFWHGYVSIHLEGRWVRATPAFNVELCQKFRIRPLEFDGREDSVFHPFDLDGNRHMEYVAQRGEFADVPIDAIEATFRDYYQGLGAAADADFDREVDAENPDV